MRARVIAICFAITFLAACGGHGSIPAVIPQSSARIAMAAPGCPKPSKPGPSVVARVALTIDAHFTIGDPISVPVAVQAYDIAGNLISGTYKYPIALVVSDSNPARPHAMVPCKWVYGSSQAAPLLLFDGRPDTFTVTGAAKGTRPALVAFSATLPVEIQLGRPSAGGYPRTGPNGAIAFATDGRIWTAISRRNGSAKFGSITRSGTVDTFTISKSANQVPQNSPICILGGDRLIWCTAQSRREGGSALDRFSPKALASIVKIGAYVYITSMAVDRRGNVWLATRNSANSILLIDASHKIRTVTTLKDTPYSLVEDPLGRGMWFGTSAGYALVTPAGSVSSYRVKGRHSLPARFFLGSDGNFWMPWAFGKWSLLKFDRNGSVVSSVKMAHASNYPVPVLGQSARDRAGNTFTVFTQGNAVFRFGTQGDIDEYSTTGRDPEGIALGPDGRMYVTDTAVLQKPNSGYSTAGGLVVFDPSFF
jgi:Two component regulator propeller